MTKNKTGKKNNKEEKKRKGSPDKGTGKRLKKEFMINSIIAAFRSSPRELFNYKQISNFIGAENKVQRNQVAEILHNLAADNFISEIDRGRYRYNDLGVIAIGTFSRRSNGKNSFLPEDGGAPIFVAERNSGHAMDGDKVKVQLLAKRKHAEPEAEVIEVLDSQARLIVGKLQITKGFAFLITESKTLANDVFIPKDKLKGGKHGDKVVVRIIEWPDEAKNPLGEVVDILGVAGDNNAEMHAILAEFDLPYKYPVTVEKAADKIPDTIPAEELANREDFRNVTTFTIDPKDAKDFDDALSARSLENGNWEVGVHIADVTYYVKPESLIDREAFKRATSVYLVDRTIPMLPERLCNQICSLRPDEEKLCFAVIFELNNNADIVKSHITRTIIKSNRRFTYEEAQQVIETGEGDYKDEILSLNELAKKLRDKRFKNGAISFERTEVRFDIDENGKPLGTYIKESKEANKLIEEFMLLANRTVAEFAGKVPKGKSKKTFVYRIHEQPDPEKLENFSAFVSRLGHKLKTTGTKTEMSKGINKLLDSVQGLPEENLIETLAIRSMQKARYTTENVGHYGLAMDYYTHFTSPIRRYPDMMVHRLLERYLGGGRSVVKTKYEEYCDHCSAMELVAASAERASIKYKQVEFMSDKIGKVFDGVITGVTEWGLYVELIANKCEGLVPIRDLSSEYFDYDDKNYCLVGRQTRRVYRLGDKMAVKVAQANLERKQLDFTPAE
ncbi:ribonuclease R [Parabacteroides sp. AM08-6]|uniref:ribonuclease R n=1 Tax=Parabacteroides sp. AM08-6 TaxID=2292053 RepID=UPI000F008A8C|nr:ribonuclease R [Parabacteroides sp. AM08-6]RHJ79335.1 ribonuclease R [Parabacteroides sp. AM08-6]